MRRSESRRAFHYSPRWGKVTTERPVPRPCHTGRGHRWGLTLLWLDLNAGPTVMQSWSKTLFEAEDSLRGLEESIGRVRTEWPVADSNANGPAGAGGPEPESLRQLVSTLSDIVRRCEDLPKDAISTVESAWENLEADALPDWDAVGHQVLGLLTKQAEAVAQTADLVRRGKKSGLPVPSPQILNGQQALLLDRVRDFRDTWPWSTGNKPDDPDDAAAAQRAVEAMPPFDVHWQLARKYPPPPGWLDED